MKKIITLFFGLFLVLSAAQSVSAQVYSYDTSYGTSYANTSLCYCGSCGSYNSYNYGNNYGCGNSVVQNTASYYYTQGCYTYYYNGYTRSTSIISYNCQTQQTYTQPVVYSYYTSPYYTYKYSRDSGSWSPQYSNYYYGNYYYGYYNTGTQVPTPTVNCYYQNGYQLCQ